MLKVQWTAPACLVGLFILALVAYLRAPFDIVGPHLGLISAGILVALLGSGLGKVQPNLWIGIPTPWTLSDRDVWDGTHRVGAYAFVVVGLIVVILAALVPPAVSGIFTVVLLLSVSSGLTGYSYLLWRRVHR